MRELGHGPAISGSLGIAPWLCWSRGRPGAVRSEGLRDLHGGAEYWGGWPKEEIRQGAQVVSLPLVDSG